MTSKRTIRILEEKALDFCFGKHCVYENPSNTLICKLVKDPRKQEPIDYCPLVKFIEWLKENEANV